jgi:hypothetical protein
VGRRGGGGGGFNLEVEEDAGLFLRGVLARLDELRLHHVAEEAA